MIGCEKMTERPKEFELDRKRHEAAADQILRLTLHRTRADPGAKLRLADALRSFLLNELSVIELANAHDAKREAECAARNKFMIRAVKAGMDACTAAQVFGVQARTVKNIVKKTAA